MNKNLEVSVEWKDDYDGIYQDDLGKYTSKTDGKAYVDRMKEYFIDPNIILEKMFKSYDEGQDFKDEMDDLGVFYGDWEEDESYTVQYYYHEELPFSFRYEHVDHRYIVSLNYPNPTEEEREYFIQDMERLAQYERGNWGYVYCEATVTLNGVEIAHNSLWGIESDFDDEYKKEVEEDCKAQALEQAKSWLEQIKTIA